MELIPILSLIILASTISTFILAFGAYILYKIRERKGRTAKASAPETIKGEVVAPYSSMVNEKKFSPSQTDSEAEEYSSEGKYQRQPRFMSTEEFENENASVPGNPSPLTSTYAENHYRRQSPQRTEESERYKEFKRKLTMFTSDGEASEKPKQRKEDGLKWR